MIVDDLDVMRVACVEAKHQPPWAVDGHRPAPGPFATQLVQPDAAQSPKIVERLGGIQLTQAKPRTLLVES